MTPEAVPSAEIRRLLDAHGLALAAVGTGAGWVIHRLQLCDPDAAARDRAKAFIKSMIDYGGPFGAPAIIGSMQGRWSADVDKPSALSFLADALNELGDHARQYDVPLIYEPLNRYETNLACTVADGVQLLKQAGNDNVKLLADLFHMNIEEADLAAAICEGAESIGHVHFVDSNRQPAGRGHIDFAPVAAALREIGYGGYVSAEAFPIPDPDEAARLTIGSFRRYFRDA